MPWRSLNPSLQLRFLLPSLLIVSSVVIISDQVMIFRSVRSLQNTIGEQTSMAARRLVEDLDRPSLADLTVRFHRSLDQVLDLVPNITRVDVFIRQKEAFQLLISSSPVSQRTPEDYEQSVFNKGQSQTYMEEESGRPRRVIAVEPVHWRDGRVGLVTVSSSLRSVSDLIDMQSRIRWIQLGLSLLLLAGAISWLFRSTVYRSVLHLILTMNRFQSGESEVRAHEELPGEFSDLSRHLNRMLQEIAQFHDKLRREISAATAALEYRNQALEDLNRQLFETQKRLLQAERLALIGQVTATVAHEIGSPLSAVSTHLQILEENPSLEPEVQERLRIVDREINRICAVVEGLLRRTRERRAHVPVAVGEILERSVRLLEPTLSARAVVCSLTLGDGPLMIHGDPDELQQLLLNLINNALDSMPEGGRLTLSAGRSNEPVRGRTQVLITLSDSGIGIPSEKLGHIFEPFFTTKEIGKGTGLGLSVSREIMLRHEGEIRVTSTVGRGTEVKLRFPELVQANGPTTGAHDGEG